MELRIKGKAIKRSAAGRYQLLERYWDANRRQVDLQDFSPESQDLIAIQQMIERRALPDIEAGRFVTALRKVKNIWASLPGAGYGQHENAIERLQAAYLEAGGTLT